MTTERPAAPVPTDQWPPLGEAVAGPGVPPLAITGVVVTKAQLLEALRIYIPKIVDFTPLPDGEHFTILFNPDHGP